MRKNPRPNTNDELNGITPGHLIYTYCKRRHVCIRCRVRWVEANILICAPCAVAVEASKSMHKRSKLKLKDKNPRMIEIVVARDLSGNGLLLSVLSDVGALLRIRKVQSLDIRDARHGKAKLHSFRDEKRLKAA